MTLQEMAWPIERVAEALEGVARARRWLSRDVSNVRGSIAGPIDRVAEAIGVEAEPVMLRYAAVDTELRALGAALIRIEHAPTLLFIALIRTRPGHALLLAPDGRRVAVPWSEIRHLLCDPLEAQRAADVDRMLAMSGSANGRHDRRANHARARMLVELIRDAPLGGIWIVRPKLENVRAVLRDARLFRKVLTFVSANVAEMLLLVLSWWILGLMAFDTRSADTLFALWVLAVITIVPMRAAGVGAVRSLIMHGGSIIKRRILMGALKLSPDEVSGKGVGVFLSHVLESGVIEAVGATGAFAGLTSVVGMLAAVYVMAIGAGGAAHVALYLLWIAMAATLTVQLALRRTAWTETRFALTGHVVENMTGHKTRLAQKPADQRNAGEDLRLEQYMATEVAFNRSALSLDALRRIWPWAGLFALAPIVATGNTTTASLAVAAAGVLLGGTALTQWTDASAGLVSAFSAWRRVAPFWRAADRRSPIGSLALHPLLDTTADSDPLPLLQASSLTHRYERREVAAVEQVELTVRRGDRILLRGPSGSGKSTLCALLSGVRPAQSGLLFFRGLDISSVGVENWRRRVLLAPQFHANHIFTGTLAYNLFLGSTWPPSPSDRERAHAVCRGLGLGPLIECMPLGLDQPVGETGWQLSHGERTRVFLARSILQNPAIMILDETFAALDPATLSGCAEYVLDQVETLLVVAHP